MVSFSLFYSFLASKKKLGNLKWTSFVISYGKDKDSVAKSNRIALADIIQSSTNGKQLILQSVKAKTLILTATSSVEAGDWNNAITENLPLLPKQEAVIKKQAAPKKKVRKETAPRVPSVEQSSAVDGAVDLQWWKYGGGKLGEASNMIELGS
mmetsp:Transcript_12061/g.14069  ORF Transcript_12061/g.14069 Transcript_12061/m.14069 type:complete len:153 (-) Transcript_12061:575-1033(-)